MKSSPLYTQDALTHSMHSASQMTFHSALFVCFVLILLSCTASARVQTDGNWTALMNSFPGCMSDLALLLTDGSVLVHDYCPATHWYKLTPDANGNYINGKWTKTSPIPAAFGYGPFAFASAVLPDGHVLIEGGEYNFNGSCDNCGATYDPVGDRWRQTDPPDFGDVCGTNGKTWCRIGGAQSVVLPNGNLMIAEDNYENNTKGSMSKLTALLPPPYDPKIKPWIRGADVIGGNGEEGWTLLPNARSDGYYDLTLVLMIDTYKQHQTSPICGGFNAAEIYVAGYFLWGKLPGSWKCLGQTPNRLWGGTDNEEVGPAILRSDGTVAAFGANQFNAILNTDYTWTAGPNFPLAGC